MIAMTAWTFLLFRYFYVQLAHRKQYETYATLRIIAQA